MVSEMTLLGIDVSMIRPSCPLADTVTLRTGIFGVSVALTRAEKNLSVAGRNMMIQIHGNMAPKIVTKFEEKGYQTPREQLLSVQEGKCKRDLVVIDGEKALNVD
jgi:hypothetical protein